MHKKARPVFSSLARAQHSISNQSKFVNKHSTHYFVL